VLILLKDIKKLSKADKLRFLNISEGSMAECMNYIIVSYDLGYTSAEENTLLSTKIEDAGRLLTSYCNGIINNNAIK
jgi:four helix bundle protein